MYKKGIGEKHGQEDPVHRAISDGWSDLGERKFCPGRAGDSWSNKMQGKNHYQRFCGMSCDFRHNGAHLFNKSDCFDKYRVNVTNMVYILIYDIAHYLRFQPNNV